MLSSILISSSFARRRLCIPLVAVLAYAATFAVLAPPRPARADSLPLDGSTSRRAAASCWIIKQVQPSAPDGVYWLQTPKLVAPQRFYCDMTTDGGGWVLVGRGREGWTFDYAGQRSAAQVRDTPSGTAAFAPAALGTKTIDALLDSASPGSLEDGIRLRRAVDVTGTQWQELRYHLDYRAPWTWALDGGVPLRDLSIDGTSGFARTTGAVELDTAYKQVYMGSRLASRPLGFAYGPVVWGPNDPGAYVWSNDGKNAIPFTQVFVRPRFGGFGYPGISDKGLPAESVPELLSNATRRGDWGVVGLQPGWAQPDLDAQVLAFAQIGTTMYVGGKFTGVQKGAGATPVDQSYLAAFDVNTGEWLPGFRPALSGPVWDLAATPEGRLVVAGEFGNVSGAVGTAALVALDPKTGALDTSWPLKLDGFGPFGTGIAVKSLEVQDGWVYVGGSVASVTSGPAPAVPLAVTRLFRLRSADAAPDRAWLPSLSGSPWDIEASGNGDRVYVVGHFETVNGASMPNSAALDTTTGALVPGMKPWRRLVGPYHQQAILEAGDVVYQGGSQHMLHSYTRADYSFLRGYLTAGDGGDFQALARVGDTVYASCHCGGWAFTDALTFGWRTPDSYSRVEPIRYVAAFDAHTMEMKAEFQPAIDTSKGEGPWELAVDSNSCMWVGGDLNRGSWTTTGYQWASGFAVLCPRDTTPPPQPASLTATPTVHATALRWPKVADDRGGAVLYEVLADDRVVGSTYSTNYVDTEVAGLHRYWVRAVDSEGNRSATSPKALVDVPNAVPVAALSATPLSGPAPLHVDFDASASTDPDDTRLDYRWDFGDGVKEWNGRTKLGHDFALPGTYTTTLTVVDPYGAVGTASLTFTVTPPSSNPAPTGLHMTGSGHMVGSGTYADFAWDPDAVGVWWEVWMEGRGPCWHDVSRTFVGFTSARVGPTHSLCLGSWYEVRLRVLRGGSWSDWSDPTRVYVSA